MNPHSAGTAEKNLLSYNATFSILDIAMIRRYTSHEDENIVFELKREISQVALKSKFLSANTF